MTLLLTFFVLLLSFSSIQEAKFQEAIGALQNALGVLNSAKSVLHTKAKQSEPATPAESVEQSEAIAEQTAEVIDILEDAGLTDEFDVVPTKEGFSIRISSPVMFVPASATLTPVALLALTTFAEYFRGQSNELRIEGHTDDIPIKSNQYPSNWELSTSRALSVLRFLNIGGIDSERLSAAGYGEFRPIVPNDSVENRNINRRVEIFVTVKDSGSNTSRELFWR